MMVPWGDVGSAIASAPLPARGWKEFVDPSPATAPRFRWWWPNGQVSPAEIAREVHAVADAGCGGLEVSDVHHSGLLTLDVAEHGWGSPSWLAGLDTALATAAIRGITIDLTIGPSWPAATNTITPDSPAASCELAHGVVSVTGSHSGPVPAAVAAIGSGVTKQQLLAVHAVRTTGPAVKNVTPLDESSWQDVTGQVSNGSIAWTAPDSATWVLISYWLRGSGQQPEAGPFTTPTAYVVDHFSAAGTKAVTDLWEQTILTPKRRQLIRKVGRTLFEDSLEIETTGTVWTPAMPSEFARRRGYDLARFLPVLVTVKGNYQFTYAATETAHVRDDLNLTLSDLYKENHLLALRAWANDLGLELRVQPYGLSTDSADFAALLDVPEGESLGFKNLDDYRVLAGGRDLGGRTILSCEAICYANGAYSTTWHQAMVTINSFWAGGVNQSVVHGFAYADAPGATWPGFAAFSPYNQTGIGYSDAWGPRMPMWRHMPDIAAFMARTQLVLQTGLAHYDLLFYRQKGYTSTGIGAPWATASGIPIGWTHIFATDALLQLPGVEVHDGVLAPDGPAIKAIVLGPDQFGSSATQISVTGAKLLLKFAQAGLPVVVYGDWSAPISTGHVGPEDDATVAATIAELLTLPNVGTTTDQTQIGAVLDQLGVTPTLTHAFSNLMHVHRVSDGRDLYYLANAQHQVKTVLVPIDQSVTLTATSRGSVPYRLDAWTGTIEPIAEYAVSGDTVTLDVRLLPGESTVVVLAEPDWAGPAARHHVVDTTADAVRYDGPKILGRTATAGQVSATLESGAIIRGAVAALPDPIELSQWQLRAEDWQPGATATETITPIVTVDLDALVPWTAIPQLADSSGVGHYTTTVTLPSGWKKVGGAVLDLGSVLDTFRVWVNGRRVPSAGLVSTKLDVGDYLLPGGNTIEVEVATTLINRLRVVTPSIYGIAKPSSYGLLGPVTLTPYGETELA